MTPRMEINRASVAVVGALLAIAAVAYWLMRPGDAPKPASDGAANKAAGAAAKG